MGTQYLRHLTEGKDPPGMTTKTCIIGKSPSGQPTISFENETRAKEWADSHPGHRITWVRQTITEEEVQIKI